MICSGASAFIPPVEGLREGNNVVGLRNLDDAILIKEQAKKVKNAVVLGAGLVGIDALSGLLNYDINISLVEMGDKILPLQLDGYASNVYEEKFKEHGVNLKLGVKAEKLILDENKNPKALILNTGEEIPCELVIVATGVRSNISFLENSNVKCDRFGLMIDEKGKTNIDDVYGAGDISGRNPIWPTAVKEGIIAANNMIGNEMIMTDFFGSKNTMNFVGVATMSLGMIEPKDDTYIVEIKNEENNLGNEMIMTDFFGSKNTMNFVGVATMSLGMIEPKDDTYIVEIKNEENNYKKIIHKDGKIYGSIIQGDLSYAGVLTQLIKENIDVSKVKNIKENIDVSKVKKSLFDIDYSDFFNIEDNFEFSYK